MSSRLLVITPCRDEAAHARTSIASVLAQTRRPDLWVIVDDGSTDGTSETLLEIARDHRWIRIVRRTDRGHRDVGPSVVDAFETGLDTVELDAFEFIGKLDLDVELPPTYFEDLLARMELDPRLGTCSGKPYVRRPDGRLVPEVCGDETSVGMTKLYRTECLRQIGGLVRGVMWDGIDCHRCRMLGWTARSWDEPALRFVHLRPMGSSQRGLLRGRMRHGAGQWFMGTGPFYMLASAVYRMGQRPYLVGGVAMFAGYLGAWLRRDARYDDAEFRGFLRRYQRECLLRGKSRATARLDASQAARWRVAEPAA